MAIRTPREAGAEKQGIAVAILASDAGGGGGARRGASLRRTLSADMSSKKWMEQNGLGAASPMKRIASSKDFNSGEVDGEEEEEERVEIKKEFDIWSSIISQKASNPPVYIHPLVKRAKSSLSENSLQVCTESLGSETGSDGFSASSDASDSESECSQKEEAAQTCREKSPEEDHAAVKSPARKLPASFPPPLPSLSSRCGGDGSPTIRMRSHRVNGRLVVEAVSVPASRKNFAAQRRDGRLVLVFSGKTEEEEEEEEEVEEEAVYEATRRVEFVTEPRVISFHKLALMADKRRNNPDDVAEKKSGLVAASLPPRPRGPGGRLNHYEYFWRTKLSGGSNDSKTVENDKRQRVVLEGHRGDGFLVSSLNLKGCYEKQRRPLTWEPRCIATS